MGPNPASLCAKGCAAAVSESARGREEDRASCAVRMEMMITLPLLVQPITSESLQLEHLGQAVQEALPSSARGSVNPTDGLLEKIHFPQNIHKP